MHTFKIYLLIIILLSGLLVSSCGTNTGERSEVSKNTDYSAKSKYSSEMPETLKKGIETMGGIEKWDQYGSISYDLKRGSSADHQLIDLKNRNLLITSDQYTIGYDGQEVWITPSIEAKTNPRFYSSLFFYFFCIPYVLNDPGVIYEDLGRTVIEGKEYEAVKISFESGIGDADQDEYICHFDPDTRVMDWLLYTVTYHGGERKDKFNALNYTNWVEVEGLKFPGTLTGYHFNNDTIGDQRYKAEFSNIGLEIERPDPELFVMPEGAEVDSLKH